MAVTLSTPDHCSRRHIHRGWTVGVRSSTPPTSRWVASNSKACRLVHAHKIWDLSFEKLSRRRVLEGTLLLTTPLLQPIRTSAEEAAVSYSDAFGFGLSYPSSWTFSEAQSVDKAYIAERTMVWYPKDIPPRDVNVTLLINNAGADFTSLGSFGSAEEFGNSLVNSMDRSYLLKGYRRPKDRNTDVQTAKLINTGQKRGMYSVEYSLKQPDEEEKRLLSLIGLRFDGTYNRLYTLIGQCNEADYGKYQKDIETVMDSFVLPSKQ